MNPPPSTQERSELKVHLGQILMMVANTYPSLMDSILEHVQNALDAEATLIGIRINMKKRSVDVVDNGVGVTKAKFNRGLSQIGLTQKSQGKMGRWGRGLISFIGKCDRFVFTSCYHRRTADGSGYLEWEFVTNTIQSMKNVGSIPVSPYPNARYHPTAVNPKTRRPGDNFYVAWRTRVRATGIVKDRVITRMTPQQLADEIVERYGPVMRKLSTVVRIDHINENEHRTQLMVEAKEYEGRPLDEVTYRQDDCGDTEFRLFIAARTPRGARKGKVCFGEVGDDFRIGNQAFWNSVKGLMDQPAYDGLRSGIFEGEIVCQGVSLDAGRKKFVANDALMGMCQCVNRWFAEVGQKHVAEIESRTREDRHQKLGLRSLRVIEGFLQDSGLNGLVEEFKIGSIGRGHKRDGEIGLEKKKSKSTQGGQGKQQKGKRRQKGEPDKDLPRHRPATVKGPDGTRRKKVRGHSTGLNFDFDGMPTSPDPYTFDVTTGTIIFNTGHKFWWACEVNDTSLMRYMETVALFAINELMLSNEDNHLLVRNITNGNLEAMVFSIINADSLSGRRRVGKKPAASAEK